MNYKTVIRDYGNGTIDKDKWQLCIDNDGGYWMYIGPEISEEEERKLQDAMGDKYGEPGGYDDVVAILCGAGVNAEWV